jgi:proprotein convertase subtilisin/kexin type 5
MCLTCADEFVTSTKSVTVDGTTKTMTMCTRECGPGMYPDGAKVCTNSCLENCSKCTNGNTCLRCKNDFLLDDSKDTHACVAETDCPTGTFGNKLTGKCEACDSSCLTCQGHANWCTSCPTTHKFFEKAHKCFKKCPQGTFEDAMLCTPCKTNVLNCDQTTGDEIMMGSITCEESCSSCFWDRSYCLSCAEGFKLAHHGRCVKECPENTVEMTMNNMSFCKECSTGCLK